MNPVRVLIPFLAAVAAASACTSVEVRALWAKQPGSKNNLFAFSRDGKVGFIDNTGRVVMPARQPGPIEEVAEPETPAPPKDPVPFEADSVRPPVTIGKAGDQEWRVVSYPGLHGFKRPDGAVAIEAKFAEVGPFSEGLARVVEDGACHIPGAFGERFGTPTTGAVTYPGVSCPGSRGNAPDGVEPICRSGFVDPRGRFAIPLQFESAGDFHDGLAPVRVKGQWGYIDARGRMVISPRFAGAASFSEGLAAVKQGDLWGYIDRTGRMVIEPRFGAARAFSESMAVVGNGSALQFINRKGEAQPFGNFYDATDFVQGLAAVARNATQVDYIDRTGKVVFRYER